MRSVDDEKSTAEAFEIPQPKLASVVAEGRKDDSNYSLSIEKRTFLSSATNQTGVQKLSAKREPKKDCNS